MDPAIGGVIETFRNLFANAGAGDPMAAHCLPGRLSMMQTDFANNATRTDANGAISANVRNHFYS